jgi:oligoribonuclease NrnB/cAMP/cGMP phosphodiesterase (DHH superfamily)
MNEQKPLVITHKDCTDGCCSQAIIRSKFGNNAIYLELDHSNLDIKKDINANEYINQILGTNNSEVYIADFCLNTNMIDQLLKQNNKVVILDHHASSIPFVTPFEKRMEEGENLNIEIHFSKENNCSGSMLTWKYFYPELEPTLAIKHVSAGDIWKFEFGDSTKHFYTGLLETYKGPKNIPLEVWENLIFNDNYAESFISIGKPLHEQFMNEVMDYVPKGKPIVLHNTLGFMIEAPKKYTSDLGNQLAKINGGFGLVYNLDPENGVVRCSLRSIEPLDVSLIAKKFGGGGHAQSSSFRCKNMEEFNDLLISEGNTISLGKRIKP